MAIAIRKAAVLGAGVMGASIAAHLANAGIQTLLLDLATKTKPGDRKANRNLIAEEGIKRLVQIKPSPLFTKESADLIIPGNFDDDLPKVQDVDWIIEAVVEKLEVKKGLFSRVEGYWKEGTLVTTNTSGVSIAAIVEGRGEAFRRHFLGTHFFNPPRYMKLVEMIPGKETDFEFVRILKEFMEKKLGKGVVIARDTPNFIANRIGVYGMMVTLKEMEKKGLAIEEVDALTGPLIGRPKSATFRTLDMVGLDTFILVANNVNDHIQDSQEKAIFSLPSWLNEMVGRGQLGDKSGKGFYMKRKLETGKDILVFDFIKQEYVPSKKANPIGLESMKNIPQLSHRLKTIVNSPTPAGELVWGILKKTLLYSAAKIPEIAEDTKSIDQAMKWGFNWKLGPFEIWDILGLKATVERMRKEGETIPPWIDELIGKGVSSFYEKKGEIHYYHSLSGELVEEQQSREMSKISDYKNRSKPILSNHGASLYDIGDGVACLVFHSPNQTIGYDIIEMLHHSIKEVEKNYRGLVIHHDGENFSPGANLMMVLMEAQDENWDELEQMVHRFQQANQAIKYARKPVVVAPFGMALGGGAEICLPAARIQASAETYMGLVETGVGLIPAGGGCKELLLRYTEYVDALDQRVDLQPFVNKAFETIALAKVSTSAEESRKFGFLRNRDGITMNRDSVLYYAKHGVLSLAQMDYEPPRKKDIRVVGRDGEGVLKLMIYSMKQSRQISQHDEKIARTLAHVLCGGDVTPNTKVTEQHILDLEREGFLSLLGEAKTQERMQYMMLKGKPLRN